jgi:two-component system sensor histidine kinase RegB
MRLVTVAADLAPNLALPWVLRLRYGMVAGEAAIIVGMSYGFHLDIPLLWTLAPLAVVLASNIWLGRLRVLPFRFPQETLGAIFCLDTLCLTAILGLAGGPMNPFSLLYLVQITLSAVVLRKVWTWALGTLSTICFGLLFLFDAPSRALSPHLAGMWVAFVIAAALITFFTGKIADELRTPLATIAVVAKDLERYAAALEDAKLIRSEVERCRRILERMSAQSAGPMGESPTAVRVRDFFAQVLEQFPEPQRALLEIELADEDLAAVLPRQATAQSLAALIQNALDANSDRRPIRITAAGIDSKLRIVVEDHGYGMPADVLRRIAEPFFTTKEPGKGMGLGTFLVRTFAESLGGRVVFDSIPGKGTTATLELPFDSSRQNAHAAI